MVVQLSKIMLCGGWLNMDKNYMESIGIDVDEPNIQISSEIERINTRQENHLREISYNIKTMKNLMVFWSVIAIVGIVFSVLYKVMK
jgi:hypothetical protein